MSATLTFIAIIDVWTIAIIVGLLAVRKRKQKPIVEVSMILDEEIPPQVEKRTHGNLSGSYEDEDVVIIGNDPQHKQSKVEWRPINPLQNQRKESYLYPLSVFNPKNRKYLLWAFAMFIITVIVGLNGGRPLTP